MKSLGALLVIISLLIPNGAGAAGAVPYGINADKNEIKRLEFEKWLEERLTSAIIPFVGESKFLITVNITLPVVAKAKVMKTQVFLSKIDTSEMLVYTPQDKEKPKSFYEKIKRIEISIAHDGTVPDETIESAKTLASKLVPLVDTKKIKVAALKLLPAPVKEQVETSTAARPEAKPQVFVTTNNLPAPAAPVVSGPESSPYIWVRDLQNLIGSILVSFILGGTLVALSRGRRNETARRYEGQPSESSSSTYTPPHSTYTPPGYSDSSASSVNSVRDIQDAEVVETPSSHAPTSDFVDFAVANFLPAEVAFSLPADLMQTAFSNLSLDEKIGTCMVLQSESRAEFISKVAPANSKLSHFLSFEIRQLESDPLATERIESAKPAYLRAYTDAVKALTESDARYRDQVKPLLDEWVRRGKHGARNSNAA